MVNFFFDGWEPVLRVLVVGSLGYLALVVLLRSSGKRTLAQMSAFDFIITVAIGASFGRVLTARTVPLVEAVVAFALLIALQVVVSNLQLRSTWFRSALTGDPTLLYHRGEIQAAALRRVRLTESALHVAARQHGAGSLDEVAAIVLEPTGSLSVIGSSRVGDGGALPQD